MKDKSITSHAVSFDEQHLQSTPLSKKETVEPADEAVQSPDNLAVEPDSFQHVFRRYASVMRTYRNFIALTLAFVPLLSHMVAEKQVSEFAQRRGTQRLDLSNDERTVYELSMQSSGIHGPFE
jgi:hypothetical protein